MGDTLKKMTDNHGPDVGIEAAGFHYAKGVHKVCNAPASIPGCMLPVMTLALPRLTVQCASHRSTEGPQRGVCMMAPLLRPVADMSTGLMCLCHMQVEMKLYLETGTATCPASVPC